MEGFVVGKGMEYAAIPFGEELMIVYKGQQLKVCKTEDDARNYINNHKKGKSQAKLPLDG
jgi:hypothetical protein